MQPNNFLHKKNYYIVSALNFIIKFFFKFLKVLGLPFQGKTIANTVLFIEPAHLGDTLLTTPAIRFLKENRKNLKILCLLSNAGKLGLENNKYVDKIITIELSWYNKKSNVILQLIHFAKLVKTLKKIKPETAINVRSTNYQREHLAMWLAGIPQRIGYSHKGLGFILTHEVQYKVVKQAARLKLDLITDWLKINADEYSLKPDFFITKPAKTKASILMDNSNIKAGQLLIAINPGAQHNFLWKKEYYVELCNLIFNNCNAKIIFVGTLDFENYVKEIQNNLNFETYSFVGQTSLSELAAILEKIALLITVDTGIRYIASAIGLKTIVLRNGANSSIEFGKHVVTENIIRFEVPCSPCGKEICPIQTVECMIGIKPNYVFNLIKILCDVKNKKQDFNEK